MAYARGHSMLIGGGSFAPTPPVYTGRIRYTYADGTQLETTGTGDRVEVAEASQIPEDKIAGLLKIEIGEEITEIGWYLFRSEARSSESNSIQFKQFNGEVVIADTVTTIGVYSFGLWEKFNNAVMNIPPNVTEIGQWAFATWAEYNQPTMNIPNGIHGLYTSTFAGWFKYNQPTMDIPDSVTTLGTTVFSGWEEYNQSTMHIPDTVASIGGGCFKGWTKYNQSTMAIPTILGMLQGSTFYEWKSYNKQSMIIPASVVYIDPYEFSSWESYDRDFVFEHTNTIPSFKQSAGWIWQDWVSHHPAKIVIPNMTGKTNSDWKTAIGEYNYNNGDIESINGVLWADIP